MRCVIAKRPVQIPTCSLIVLAVLLLLHRASGQSSMTISSFSGPVTSAESGSFLSYMTAQTPAANNIGNNWAQGTSGENVKAMGLVYEITRNTAILDQMIRSCDAVLSERNDLAPAPTGQYVIWTGGIDPVWPNTTTTPIGTGGEQGDPVGHLGNCARLILETPSIWNINVTIGDPDNLGTTYIARAKAYVQGGDTAISGHILKYELDLSNGDHQYFAAADPYKGGEPVPWNQQMMFNYAFQNLAIDHDILGDNAILATQYREIVRDSIDWFFASGATPFTDTASNTAYSWYYAMPGPPLEDNDHGSLDVNGFYRAYAVGEYGITPAMMAPFGTTFTDIMTLGPKDYAGVINGTTGSGNSASTDYIRSGWLLTADFLPSRDYATMLSADFSPGGTTTNADRFSKFLWMKNERYQWFTLTGSSTSQTITAGSSAKYTATVTAQGAFTGAVSLSVSGLPGGATASFSPSTITGNGASTLTVVTTAATPNGTYTLTILGSSMGTVAQSASATLVVTQAPSTPSLTPTGPLSFTAVSGGVSATQTLRLTNPGTVTLANIGIALTGTASSAFTESNACGSSLVAGASCVITVVFAPTSPGSDAASLCVTDNAAGSPQMVALAGTAAQPASADFSISASPSTLDIAASSSGSVTISVAAIGGTLNGAVSLSATNAQGATITFAPVSVSPGSGSATSTMTVQASSTMLSERKSRLSAMGDVLPAFVLPCMFMRNRRRLWARRGRIWGLLGLLCGSLSLLSGCGGSEVPQLVPKNVAITVSGVSASNTHTTTVNVAIQ